jgi:general secretion pathway protein L
MIQVTALNTDVEMPAAHPNAQAGPFVALFVTGDKVIAVVPALDVALHRVELPVRSDAQARRAAPFAVEDDVAADPGHVHVALGGPLADGARLVAIASRDKMDAWAGALPHIPSGSAALVPEACALAGAADGPVIADRGDTIVAALPGGLGFAADADLFQRIAGELFAEHDLTALTVYSDRPDKIIPHALPAACAVERQPLLRDQDYAELLIRGAPAASLSLLQGPYAPRTPWRVPLQKWRTVLAGAALIVISYAVLLLSQGGYYAGAADDLRRRTESVARDALPDVTRIVNPRTQVLARLNGAGGPRQSAFLPLTSALFESLEAMSGSRLEAMLFDQNRGSLTATVSVSAYGDMDAIRAALVERGLELREGASRTSGSRIVSEITVSRR